MTEAGATHQQPNRLVNETSPYLLQHAYNPVEWYPWGQDALQRAVEEDKPILLSVGYSACHWCHVMAHESFEDPQTAGLMNEHFVNIKVDREERPDLDAIYMEAVQAMTGQGGWPMTVFLTPAGEPFYGGTYFPPTPRQGMPSFSQLLLAVNQAWQERREDLENAGRRVADALQRSARIGPSPTALDVTLLDRAAAALLRSFDRAEGGFRGAPKFPQPMTLDFLVQEHLRTGKQELWEAVNLTLVKMGRGGIYDHLGGGFHRYSTDAHWLVPHFEKMLYDNAQMARTYLHAWQITGDAWLKQVVEETLDYVLREMTSPDGGFYSTQDADSEGEEGKFYLWTLNEVTELLGEEDATLFAAYYDVTTAGNFREGGPGRNILNVPLDLETVARNQGVPVERLVRALERGSEILLARREQRVRPGRDDKILAEWNGLMIHAFAEAGAALNRAEYLDAAIRAAHFVLERMSGSADDGTIRLYRSYKDGRARVDAYLEDYTAVALSFFALYQATLEFRWLQSTTELAQVILALFFDREGGGFFQTSLEHEQLVARRKEYIDSAVPSGNSLAAELYLRLGKLLEREEYSGYAAGILQKMADAMAEQPTAFGRLLCALDFYLNPGQEIAIIGDPGVEETRALLAEVWSRFLPNSVLALGGDDATVRHIPFLADRSQIAGRPTAYVCQNYACNLPVTEPEALAAQLGRT